MTVSFDPDRTDSPSVSSSRRKTRPPIWTGGRQRPPFDLRSFWRVSCATSRDLMWPALARIGELFERAAHRVACGFGAKAVAKLGKGARVLPPRRSVVASLRGTGLWLLVAADRIDRIGRTAEVVHDLSPEAEPAPLPLHPRLGPELAATSHVIALRPAREAPAKESVAPALAAVERQAETPPADSTPPPAADPDDPLAAIRSMMRAAAAPVPAPRRPALHFAAPAPEPDPVTGLAALPPLAAPEPPAPGPSLRIFGAGTGLALFSLSLPLGGLLAGYAWLRGEDLRLRETG